MTERLWQQTLEQRVFDAYMMAAETMKSRIACEPYVEIHEALDDLIAQHSLEWLSAASASPRITSITASWISTCAATRL